jgi:eukaryotic-like serine/threonine-protein kinase
MIDVNNLIGHFVEGWKLWEILGKGVDGIVYVGERDGNQCAIKLFLPDRLEKYGLGQERERLEMQLRLRGEKRHPNLVQIFSGGFSEELQTLYLIMEYVPGKSLDKLLGKIPPESVAPLTRQLASAARFLETQDLYHRDIKPANVVVSDDFTKLTLLDLGIVTAPTDGDERLSGEEFVASLRYSPPEFVRRQEDGDNAEAWQAVTYYQIGATMYDMIVGRQIFSGFDKPRALLYEAVKLRTPQFPENKCDEWLVQLAKCCLVKSWRHRLDLVRWDHFQGPVEDFESDTSIKLKAIRLKQIQADEERVLKKEEALAVQTVSKSQELWKLQDSIFLEVRHYLISSQVFPKFSGTHKALSDKEYVLEYMLEADESLMFPHPVSVSIHLSNSKGSEVVTNLTVSAAAQGLDIFRASWTEAFTVETATKACQDALVQIAERAMSLD